MRVVLARAVDRAIASLRHDNLQRDILCVLSRKLYNIIIMLTSDWVWAMCRPPLPDRSTASACRTRRPCCRSATRTPVSAGLFAPLNCATRGWSRTPAGGKITHHKTQVVLNWRHFISVQTCFGTRSFASICHYICYNIFITSKTSFR